MRASTGAFRIRIASLKYYGLLDGAGGNFRISQLFRELDRSDEGTDAFRSAAFEAIKRVPIFARVMLALRYHLPSQDALTKRLTHDFGFSTAGAQKSAAVLRESLTYAGVLDGSGNIVPPRYGSSEPVEEPEAETVAAGGGALGERKPSTAGPGSGGALPEIVGQLQLQLPILVSPGRHFTLLVPQDLQPHEANYIQHVLGATLRALTENVQSS